MASQFDDDVVQLETLSQLLKHRINSIVDLRHCLINDKVYINLIRSGIHSNRVFYYLILKDYYLKRHLMKIRLAIIIFGLFICSSDLTVSPSKGLKRLRHIKLKCVLPLDGLRSEN